MDKSNSTNGNDQNDLEIDRFVQLFAQHQRRVHAYIGAVLPCRSDADDVMQETSIALWRKWGDYDPSRDFFRWACGVAHIEVLRYRRKHARQKLFLNEELMEDIAEEVLRQPEIVEMRAEALQLCLHGLSEKSLQMIEHRYGQGRTVLQTARDMGRPPSTIYKAMARIRKSLLACIRQRISQELSP